MNQLIIIYLYLAAGGTDVSYDTPALRRINGVGRSHPLSSVELDPITDGVLDNDDVASVDDVLEGSGSMKSGGIGLYSKAEY